MPQTIPSFQIVPPEALPHSPTTSSNEGYPHRASSDATTINRLSLTDGAIGNLEPEATPRSAHPYTQSLSNFPEDGFHRPFESALFDSSVGYSRAQQQRTSLSPSTGHIRRAASYQEIKPKNKSSATKLFQPWKAISSFVSTHISPQPQKSTFRDVPTDEVHVRHYPLDLDSPDENNTLMGVIQGLSAPRHQLAGASTARSAPVSRSTTPPIQSHLPTADSAISVAEPHLPVTPALAAPLISSGSNIHLQRPVPRPLRSINDTSQDPIPVRAVQPPFAGYLPSSRFSSDTEGSIHVEVGSRAPPRTQTSLESSSGGHELREPTNVESSHELQEVAQSRPSLSDSVRSEDSQYQAFLQHIGHNFSASLQSGHVQRAGIANSQETWAATFHTHVHSLQGHGARLRHPSAQVDVGGASSAPASTSSSMHPPGSPTHPTSTPDHAVATPTPPSSPPVMELSDADSPQSDHPPPQQHREPIHNSGGLDGHNESKSRWRMSLSDFSADMEGRHARFHALHPTSHLAQPVFPGWKDPSTSGTGRSQGHAGSGSNNTGSGSDNGSDVISLQYYYGHDHAGDDREGSREEGIRGDGPNGPSCASDMGKQGGKGTQTRGGADGVETPIDPGVGIDEMEESLMHDWDVNPIMIVKGKGAFIRAPKAGIYPLSWLDTHVAVKDAETGSYIVVSTADGSIPPADTAIGWLSRSHLNMQAAQLQHARAPVAQGGEGRAVGVDTFAYGSTGFEAYHQEAVETGIVRVGQPFPV